MSLISMSYSVLFDVKLFKERVLEAVGSGKAARTNNTELINAKALTAYVSHLKRKFGRCTRLPVCLDVIDIPLIQTGRTSGSV